MYQPGQFQVSRCQFAMAGITVGAAHFAPQQLLGKEQSSFEISATATHPTIQPGLNASFAPLNQIDAGLLNVGYAESGPRNGTAVVLLHGWPYDIYSYVDVVPLLVLAGYRVIVPYLCGYGTTRFLSSETVRNGQQSIVAVDIVDLMDVLNIRKAIVGGFYWGARTANIMAALWPERCKALVSVSGYLIGSPAINATPLPPTAELAWWYQFYFSTERGKLGYRQNTSEFNKLIWHLASPKWNYSMGVISHFIPERIKSRNW